MKGHSLILSLSKGERRPQAAKGKGGSAHFFNSLPTLKFRVRFRREVEATSRHLALGAESATLPATWPRTRRGPIHRRRRAAVRTSARSGSIQSMIVA